MRRVTWLVLLGAACIGCSRKDPPELPSVAIQPNESEKPKISLPEGPPKSRIFTLAYATLWNPKGAEKFEAEDVAKAIIAAQHFSQHQTEYLAPATVGLMVSVPQGGLHGVVTPAALASVYPAVAQRMGADWTDRVANAPFRERALIDISSSGTGPSTRTVVLRVKDGTDDELRIQFGEYLVRLEAAVKGTGVTITAHPRGGNRQTGSLSDLKFESETHTGYVRSVVVRAYDPKDHELITLMFGGGAKGRTDDLIEKVMATDKGPFLIVSLREERR